MKRVSVVLVLFVSLAAVVVAGDVVERDLYIQGRDLAKRSFTAPNLSFDLYSRGTIDVGPLIEGVNLTKGESAESIYAKVDMQRQRLYPDEEIILSITIPEPVMISAVAGASLVRSIYWWNNVNPKNTSFFAQYYSTAGTCFISDIKYGNYKIYANNGNGKWVYKRRMGAGYSWGGCSYGTYALRGFEGVATIDSVSDIVMYFFK
jgi:hypothetical protein